MSEQIIELTQFDEDEQPPISFTSEAEKAAEDAYFSEKMQAPNGLRVGLRGGGCAGFQYILDFTKPNDNDFIMELGKIKVYIDPVSATHLEGTIIDYVTSLMGNGFKFINPNATKTCGCGSSFG